MLLFVVPCQNLKRRNSSLRLKFEQFSFHVFWILLGIHAGEVSGLRILMDRSTGVDGLALESGELVIVCDGSFCLIEAGVSSTLLRELR